MKTPAAITPDSPLLAQGKELVGRAPVEHGVAPGHEEAVRIGFARKSSEHRRLVHSDADCAHDALVAEPCERRERAGKRVGVVVVGIVHERDVDAVETEPLEAPLERAQRAVGGEVEVGAVPGGRAGLEKPADLCRHDVLVAGLAGQRRAEPLFREPGAVVRRGVEVPNTEIPRAGQRRRGPASSSTGSYRPASGAPCRGRAPRGRGSR